MAASTTAFVRATVLSSANNQTREAARFSPDPRMNFGWCVCRRSRMPLLGGRIGVLEATIHTDGKGISEVKLSHTLRSTSAVFDDPNLVSAGGLVPVLALAESAGLRDLADQHLTVPTDKGANAGLKVASLVGGMVAGADSIDDMALLRHGAMCRVFARAYAPSTLGSFLRAFTFGHVRQLDAVASRFLIALAGLTGLLRVSSGPAAGDGDTDRGYALLDVDDTIIEVHGHVKQGAGFGYSGVRGLNALLATLTIAGAVPVVVAQRLRRGSTGSPRGAKRLVGDAVRTAGRLLGQGHPILVRMDSAFYGRGPVHAALAGGAAVSVTVRMDKRIKAAIATIGDDAWTTIEYTDAVFDETTGRWVSRAEAPRCRSPRSPRRRGPTTCRAGWWCAGSRTSTPRRTRQPVRTSCSTPGGSTPSSPPPAPTCWTLSPRTRPTAITRSSSRSTPTSKGPPWRTCRPGCSPPTRPGWCSQSSRSTSPAPPELSRRRTSRKRPPRPCAAS